MKSWWLLTLVVALFALSSCQEASTFYDFDEDGSLDADDCARSDPLIHPGADDPYGDGIDSNCDGVDGNAVDLDGDGYSNAVDCDDTDPDIHPGATDEPGDGIHPDIDGVLGCPAGRWANRVLQRWCPRRLWRHVLLRLTPLKLVQ